MSALYTPEMLALSTQLTRYPWSDRFAYQAEARSKVCGSVIVMGLDLDADGAVATTGLKVTACAVGQSAAAIFASGAQGVTRSDIERTLGGLERWLTKQGDLPDWPGLGAIAGALEHKGRHGALLLPWETAVKALSSAQ